MKKKNNKKWISALSCFCATLLAFVGFSALIKPKTNRIEAAALSKDEYNIADYEWANYFNFANVSPNASGYFTEAKCTITMTDNSLSLKFLQDVNYQDGVNTISRCLRLSTDTYDEETGVLPDITEFDCSYVFSCDTYIIMDDGENLSMEFPVKLILCVTSSNTAEVTWVQYESATLPTPNTNARRMYLDVMPNMTTDTTFFADYTYVIENFALYKGTTVYDYTPYFYSLDSMPSETPDDSSGGSVVNPGSGSGDSSSGGSDSSTDKPTGDYEQGFQDGLGTAKYSFFYGSTLNVSLLLSNGSVLDVGQAPFGYVYGGITFGPTASWLASEGYNMSDVSGVRLCLKFADPILGDNLYLQALGNSACFSSEFLTLLNDGSTVPSRFSVWDSGGYIYEVYTSDIDLPHQWSYVEIQDWDIYGITNLSTLFLLDYSTDYDNGYKQGYSDGTSYGYELGEDVGYDNGYKNGKSAGESIGYEKGLNKSNSFLGLMVAVVDAPVTVFTSMLNFDVLGYNMKNLATGLLTVALIICLIKFFSKGSAE